MIIGCSGHRKIAGSYSITPTYNWAEEQTKLYLINQPVKQAITGCAIGYDFLFALVCLDLNIPLICAVPFIGQEKYWPEKVQQQYHNILKQASKIVYIGDPPSQEDQNWKLSKSQRHNAEIANKMIKLNQYIVDNSDALLILYDNRGCGGTYQTLQYAKQQNKLIKIINPKCYKP